jgi:hypothetical protein
MRCSKQNLAAALLAFSLALSAVCFDVQALAQPCGRDWEWASPRPQGGDLRAVAWGAGRFVSVGAVGTIVKSTDGRSWDLVQWGAGPELNDVRFESDRFLAVGDNGAMLSSEDASAWTPLSSGVTGSLRCIAHGPPGLVVVGYDWSASQGILLTSRDGFAWQQVPSAGRTYLYSVTWADTRFVAVGADATTQASIALTSSDGVTWDKANLSLEVALTRIAYAEHLFLGVGGMGDAGLYRSQDGFNWTPVEVGSGSALSFVNVAYCNQRFVAIATLSGAANARIYSSQDGTHWTDNSPTEWTTLTAVTYGGGQYLVVGHLGMIERSEDGSLWTPSTTTLEPSVWMRAVSYGAGKYVAVGGYESGDDRGIFSGPDGRDWTLRQQDHDSAFWGVAFGGGTFMAVGGYGDVFASADGDAWTKQPFPFRAYLQGIAYGNSRFVVCQGGGATAYVTPDGVAWDSYSMPEGVSIAALVYAASTFVAVGQGPSREAAVCTSRDGRTWTLRSLGMPGRLSGVAFGAGRFVAVGYDESDETGIVAISTDGATWTIRNVSDWMLGKVAFGAGQFAAIGYPYGPILASSDGAEWAIVKNVQEGLVLGGIGYGPQGFVVVGSGSCFLRSPCSFIPAPPVVDALAKMGPPFKIRVTGNNLQYGLQVFIDGKEWPNVSWVPPRTFKLLGDKDLKRAVPKGTAKEFRFVNPDGGESTFVWHW